MNVTQRLRAQTLAELGRYREAVPLLLGMLNDDPLDGWALCCLAANYLNLGEDKAALEYAEKAVAAMPDSEWAHRLRSMALLRGKNRRGALEAAQKAVAANPSSPPALTTLVNALLENKRAEDAQQVAERLREFAPGRAETFHALASVALHRGLWQDAETNARRALAIDPESSLSFLMLGGAFLQANRYQSASRAFYETLRRDPLDTDAPQALIGAMDAYLGGRSVQIATQYGMLPADLDFPLIPGVLLVASVVAFFACLTYALSLACWLSAGAAIGFFLAGILAGRNKKWRRVPPEIQQAYQIRKYRALRRLFPTLQLRNPEPFVRHRELKGKQNKDLLSLSRAEGDEH